MAAKGQRFRTKLESDERGAMCFFRIPAKVIEALGTRKRPPVVVGLGDHSYRSTVSVYGGEFMLPVRAEVQRQAGVKAGQTATVTLTLDEEPRVVELPSDLAAALKKAGVREGFDRFSYSHRREYVGAILDAKRPETREKRVALAVQASRTKLLSGPSTSARRGAARLRSG